MNIIKTERLLLRAWHEEDANIFAEINQHPKVIEFLRGPLSLEEAKAFIKGANEHFQIHGFGLWAVAQKQTNTLMGFIGLNIPTFEAAFTPCIEIGWRFGYEHWGKGYAIEGARAVLKFAFEKLAINEIVAFTARDNFRSIQVMRKIGMQRDYNGDFNHPGLAADHKLASHVLYKMDKKIYEDQKNISRFHPQQSVKADKGIDPIGEKPFALYRYSTEQHAHKSFLEGDIWFAGVIQNRGPWEESSKKDNREFYDEETRTTRLLTETLSLSLTHPSNASDLISRYGYKYCVEVKDIEGFIDAILKDLFNPKLVHKISWLNKEDFEKAFPDPKKTGKLPADPWRNYTLVPHATNNFKGYGMAVQADITRIDGKRIEYYDESQPCGLVPFCRERRASGKRKYYEFENEYRICLNRTDLDFMGNNQISGIDAAYMLKHIQLQCPSVCCNFGEVFDL